MTSQIFSLYFAARGYLLAALLGITVGARATNHNPLRWEFLFLVLMGMVLRLWAGTYLGPHGNAMKVQSPGLQNNGPYRFSRNPLYIANILTAAGLILFANCFSTPFTILAMIFLFAHHALLIHWEEKKLREQWGNLYVTYARSVPRWIGWHRNPVFTREKKPPQWNRVLRWQGRNLAYTVLSMLLLWLAAQ